jgi:hypothetical protein
MVEGYRPPAQDAVTLVHTRHLASDVEIDAAIPGTQALAGAAHIGT